MITLDILSPIQVVKGIGPARAQKLSKLGINLIKDALMYFPRDYIDLLPLNFRQGKEDKQGAYPCIVTGYPNTTRAKSGIYLTKIPITDGQNRGYAVFFNQPYIGKNFYRGDRLLLLGKITKDFGTYDIIVSEWVKFKTNKSIDIDKICPIYPLTKGISQKMMRSLVKRILQQRPNVPEILPNAILKKHKLMSINDAIYNMHFPKSFFLLKKAQHRFVFEELLIFQLTMKLYRKNLVTKKRENIYQNTDIMPFIKSLPFKLTSGQLKVIKDIVNDLKSEQNMNRLVQGDVGSGKTVVAAMALYLSVINGFQGAMMAPTEILANQHYLTLKEFLNPHGIKVGILTGGMSEKERTKTFASLVKGEIDVIVGTHALIQEEVNFYKLGMIITDEQHRFGVKQREKLIRKGMYPDVLVMSATPIPRTVALVLYSDLDISTIDVMPSGRQKVKTYVVDDGMRQRVYNFMYEEVRKGNLAYVVCPAVEDNDLGIKSVETLSRELKETFPNLKIMPLHGKMKSEDKDHIIRDFLAKKIHILVSTTVIEVGVDVPEATIMVIENAERFGLAQLHQLRGRVGRGSKPSYCILISDTKQNIAKSRLVYMMECHDGFKISKKDLRLRGPGEYFGVRQHGFGDFKFADFIRDENILSDTHNLATDIIDDGLIYLPEYARLKKLIEKKIQ